ncbi:MAG: hypothetical protein KJ958_05455 [Gammaproteobacteria bacterium]|nr:hypothetical protein [Gammaproteobacteria bacterium]MBU1978600.1 hypothetical protein [Gammaproteobacteria bacterium]
MYRKYTLEPSVRYESALEFEWDPAVGGVRGKDAARVLTVVQRAKDEGEVQGHPYPSTYPVTNPLRNSSEMAVVLGQYWKLPVDLALAYPKPEEDDDVVYRIDENGVEHIAEFQPLE